METFIGFYFWWLVAFMIIQALTLLVRKYPHTSTKNVGQDIFDFILMAVFFVWILLIRLGVIK